MYREGRPGKEPSGDESDNGEMGDEYCMHFKFRGVCISQISYIHGFHVFNSRMLDTVVFKYSQVKYSWISHSQAIFTF